MDISGWSASAAAAMAAVGALLGWFVPQLVRRIPEPPPEAAAPDGTPAGAADERGGEQRGTGGDRGRGDTTVAAPRPSRVEPKERYDTIAALPGLAWRTAAVSAAASGLVGAVLGWDPVLLVWAYLVPVGVALGLVDWRTRLLPTRVIAPSYAVVALLTVLAAAVGGDWDALLRAGWGWLVAGGTFFVLWFIRPRGLGYGDVRLSGLLGIVLGYLGWAELLTGVYAGFVLGGVGGLLLSVLRLVDRKAYPFGPFMLVGALVGVVLGPAAAAWYA